MFEEFLKSPAGYAVIGVVITLLSLAIIELNYRLFFKRTLDILFSLLFIIISSPVTLVCAIISKTRAGFVIEKAPYLGVGGKIIYLRRFAGIKGKIADVSRIFDVFTGNMSIVGVKAMPLEDGSLIDDKYLGRFNAKPGIFCHLAVSGSDEIIYEQMFALDEKYFKKRELFYDIWVVIKSIVSLIRGEGNFYLGEARNLTYAEVLLDRGTITKEDADKIKEYAKTAEDNYKKGKDFKKSKTL